MFKSDNEIISGALELWGNLIEAGFDCTPSDISGVVISATGRKISSDQDVLLRKIKDISEAYRNPCHKCDMPSSIPCSNCDYFDEGEKDASSNNN